LSETIKDASGGTETVDANGYEVPEPAAAVFTATVVSKALVPSTLAAITILTLNTFPDEAALASNTFADVFEGVRYVVFAVIVATATIFGAAIIFSFD